MATAKGKGAAPKKSPAKGEATSKAKASPKTTKKPEVDEEDSHWGDDVFDTVTPQEQKEMNQTSSYLKASWFKIEDGESARVRFLDENPLTFYQHSEYDKKAKRGAGMRVNLTCIQKDCPLCEAGSKPRYVGAYRVILIEKFDRKGRPMKISPEEQIFIKGVNTLAILEKKNSKKKITSENIDIDRTGDGFDTQYIPEFTGEKAIPKDYKKLPSANLRDYFKPKPQDLARLAKDLMRKSRGSDDDYEGVGDDDDDDGRI